MAAAASSLRMRSVALFGQPRALALFDQCVVSGSSFLTLLVVGRFLQSSEFGMFSLAMLGNLFLANVHRALFTQPMNVLGAGESEAQARARLVELTRLQLLAFPLAMLLLGALSLACFPDPWLFISCCAYLAAFFLQESARRYWYTRGRLGLALRSDVISYGGQVALLLLVGHGVGLQGATAFGLMALTSVAAFLLDIATGQLQLKRTSARPNVMAEHWPLSRWLLATVVAVWGATQLHPFLLAPLGASAVAGFVACRNLLNVVNIFGQTLSDYVPTRAALVLAREGRAGLRRHLRGTLLLTSAVAIAFLLTVLLFAEPILHLVYDGQYDHAAQLLVILALGRFLALFAILLGAYSQAMLDPRASFLANLVSLAFTLSIGLVLIARLGPIGAAWAATLSMLLATIVQGWNVALRFARLPRDATVGGK